MALYLNLCLISLSVHISTFPLIIHHNNHYPCCKCGLSCDSIFTTIPKSSLGTLIFTSKGDSLGCILSIPIPVYFVSSLCIIAIYLYISLSLSIFLSLYLSISQQCRFYSFSCLKVIRYRLKECSKLSNDE